MGWLFGYHTRKELINHLVQGNGLRTLKHCLKGNNLWAVHELVYEQGPNAGETVRFIVLYMLRGGNKERDRWGYKDVEGDSGPNYCNCPLSYLDDLSPATSYGVDWRERVRKYHADRARKFAPETRVLLGEREFRIIESMGRRGYKVKDTDGFIYRIAKKYVAQLEVL